MANIYGTSSYDSLYGTTAADNIYGYDGNDYLKGGGGADNLHGGFGIDTATYSDSGFGVAVSLASGFGSGGTADGDRLFGIENVTGSYHADTLMGDDGANALSGLDGDDTLKGAGGADTLSGGTGADILKGGGGADVLNGGGGIDTADYRSSPSSGGDFGVQVSLKTGYSAGADAQGDVLIGIENVTGSAFEDTLDGNDQANVLNGMEGDDHLYGWGGGDVIEGGDGDDVIDGGTGADVMTGGNGWDTFYVDSAADVVHEYYGQGIGDMVYASVSYALSAAAEVESLRAANGSDTARFDLAGNDFEQNISGTAGENVINGFGGADTLMGFAGNDWLIGGSGADWVVGGAGGDRLDGGSGADLFNFWDIGDSGIVAGSFDTITDFNRAEGDQIGVAGMDANALLPGDQAWTFIGIADYTAAGQIRVVSDGIDTYLAFSNDDSSDNDGAVRIVGLHNVDAGWFVL
jgi:Ca2+-binding RTX toxin-like protein